MLYIGIDLDTSAVRYQLIRHRLPEPDSTRGTLEGGIACDQPKSLPCPTENPWA